MLDWPLAEPDPPGRLKGAWVLLTQPGHHLRACQKCHIRGPAPDLLHQNLHFYKRLNLGEALSDACNREGPWFDLSTFLMPSSTSSSHPPHSLILLSGPHVRTVDLSPPLRSLSSYLPPTNHKAFPSSRSPGTQLGVTGKGEVHMGPEWSWTHRGALQTYRCLGPTPRFSFRGPGVSPTWHPWPRAQAGHPQRSGLESSSGLSRLCGLRKAV